jgi:hypothetical protein
MTTEMHAFFPCRSLEVGRTGPVRRDGGIVFAADRAGPPYLGAGVPHSAFRIPQFR